MARFIDGQEMTGEADLDKDVAPVQAILNAADALSYIARSGQGVGVRELARELRLARGTAARILHSLLVCGLLRRGDETGRFHLGSKFLELAAEHRRCLSLNEVARPYMIALTQTLHETAFLGVLDQANVVIIDQVDGPQALRMTGELGGREFAFHTGLGKIMLAALPRSDRDVLLQIVPDTGPTGKPSRSSKQLSEEIDEAGRRGWSLDDGEQAEGVRCVAAAILDQDRRVVAAISISGPAFRLPDERIEEMARHVTAAAASISRDLGYVPIAIGMAGNRA